MNRILTALLALPVLGGCANGVGLMTFGQKGPEAIDSEGGGGAVSGEAPVISAFTASESAGQLTFTFRVSDADDDLSGGEVRLTVDGVAHSFAYPDEVSLAQNGSASVSVNGGSLDRDQDYPCQIVVADRAGHSSEVARATLALGPWTIDIDENGDTPGDITGIGRIQIPAVVRGDIYRTGNDGSGYTADLDVVTFNVPATGNYTVILQWTTGGADYDVFLLESGMVDIDSGANANTTPPEVATGPLREGVDYFFAVGGWSGPAGDWTVRIE